jgi:hypothetical protein
LVDRTLVSIDAEQAFGWTRWVASTVPTTQGRLYSGARMAAISRLNGANAIGYDLYLRACGELCIVCRRLIDVVIVYKCLF